MVSAPRMCEGCRFRDSVIVELQHQIRELRHQLENERVAAQQRWDGSDERRPATGDLSQRRH
jgi:hypothetical protein